jgi:dihydroxy-acid dehydratase
MAMDTEEMIRAQPMDAVVLMGGCDKTVPAQLMAAASADIPTVQLVGGPMSTSRYKGERLGACTDCRRYWARYRAGEVDDEEIGHIEGRLATTAGSCAVMGTASTMACLAEALGMSLPDSASIPAVHADRLRIAEASGLRAAAMVGSDLRPSRILTPAAIENALRVLLAIGGSTNAVLHLTAVARRRGIGIDLHRFNELADTTPVLVSLKPVGSHYMEDLFAAGGLDPVLREIAHLLDLSALTVTGETLGERLARPPAEPVDREVVRAFHDPIEPHGGLVALFGSLAPEGAILKRSATDGRLLEHTGKAVVFSSPEDLASRIDSPDLDVGPDDILVMQNAGPRSAAAMPEAGYLPIPKKLARQGVKDMIRISDARMSGTAYGTVVLHVTPEAAIGGPLSLVRTGDRIRLSVAGRRIDLLVDESELARRRAEAPPAAPVGRRGYDRLYAEHVLQATEGCDFDFC